MKLVEADRSQLERIVSISKIAFETDVAVGGEVGIIHLIMIQLSGMNK